MFDRAAFRRGAGLALLVFLRTAVDLRALWAQPLRYWNNEELYNATVAWILARGDLWPHLLDLQYKTFCGGCTALSLISVPQMALFGDRWLAWKALALLINAASIPIGFVAVRQHTTTTTSAWAFALLLALPPRGFADVSLMLWGNHAESNLLVLGLLAMVGQITSHSRSEADQNAAGVAIWFSRTAAYGAVVVLGVGAQRKRWMSGVGFLLGVALILIPAAAGDQGSYDLSLSANVLPEGPGGALQRWSAFLDPRSIGPRIFGVRWGSVAIVGWMVVALAGWVHNLRTSGGRVLAALPVLFLLAVGVSGFVLQPFSPGTMLPGPNRYFAPWMMLLMLHAACGVGALRGRSRLLGMAVLAVLLGSAVFSRVPALTRPLNPAPSRWTAAQPGNFGAYLAERLVPADLSNTHSDDPRVEEMLRRAEGYQLGRAVSLGHLTPQQAFERCPADDAAMWGLGQAMVGSVWSTERRTTINRWLSTLPEQSARIIGRGAGQGLGAVLEEPPLGHPPAPPMHVHQAIGWSCVGLGPDEPCWMVSAAGQALRAGCRGGRNMLRCLATTDVPHEALFGAALMATAPIEPGQADRIESFGGSSAYREGLKQPTTGMIVPIWNHARSAVPSAARGSGYFKGLGAPGGPHHDHTNDPSRRE